MNYFRIPWSVRRAARVDLDDWAKNNERRRRLALSRVDSELLAASERPWKFCGLVLLLLLAIWLLGQVLPDNWLIPAWSQYREKWGPAEHLSNFATLWSVQATLAALVFPIVIAFVTVFLQRRPAAEALVHLYLLTSGALVAGLSSLSLVVLMGIQYVAVAIYGSGALPVWTALDGIWFCINSALTTIFLFRTTEFLRPATQTRLVIRYAANIALPREVDRMLPGQVLGHAQRMGWIPGPSSLKEEEEEGPKVDLHDFGFRAGTKQGEVTFKNPHRVRDLRLWPLRLVIGSWLRAAAKLPPLTELGYRKSWPELTIACSPGRTYDKAAPLAFVKAGPDLNGWQRAILRCALSFEPAGRDEGRGVLLKDLMAELESDVRIAATKHDDEQFKQAYDTLVDLHDNLLASSLFTLADGSSDSYAMLTDSRSWMGRSLHAEWTNCYRSIFLACIESLTYEPNPFERVCHLPQHLCGDALYASPRAVREQVLRLPGLLMYQLGDWWTRRVEEQGTMVHDPNRAATLRPPLSRTYDDCLRSFVSGWESARDSVAELPEADSFDWANAADIASLHSSHVEKTARMLLAAVARGDRAAAEWMADVLTKWWGSHEHDMEPWAIRRGKEFITIDQLEMPWEELYAKLSLGDNEGHWREESSATLQRGVLLAALHNYWTDVRWLTVELLMWLASQANPPTKYEDSFAIDMAAGLLRGKQWKGGGTMADPLNNFHTPQFLLALVRQYAAGGQYRGGYIGRLDAFVDSIKDIKRPSMVSARIYSFSGAGDVDSLQDLQLILLAALSSDEWKPGNELLRRIDIWMTTHYDCVAVLKNRLEELCQRAEKKGELALDLLSAVIAGAERTHDADTGLERATAGLEMLRAYVKEKREDTLEAQPVSAARLKELAGFASRKGFSSSGRFPLQLFGSSSFTAQRLSDYTFTMRKVRKGELTETEIEQRPGNEDHFWSDTMADLVGSVLISDVITAIKPRVVAAEDAESYWRILKSEAKHIEEHGEQPVLILDNRTKPSWIWDWRHTGSDAGHAKPEDLTVSKAGGRGAGYVCDLNNIWVYAGPLASGRSLLTSREAFKAVEFTKFGEDFFVEASTTARSDSKVLVDLAMTFSRHTHSGSSGGVFLEYSDGNTQSS